MPLDEIRLSLLGDFRLSPTALAAYGIPYRHVLVTLEAGRAEGPLTLPTVLAADIGVYCPASRALALDEVALLDRGLAAAQTDCHANRVAKICCGLVPLVLCILKGLFQHWLECRRHFFEADDLRAAARDHLVEGGREAPEVAAMVDEARVTPLLRWHEVGSPHHCAGHRHAMVMVLGLRQSEVCELRQAGSIQQDVRGLDVAVDDALLVSGPKAFTNLADDINRLLEREWP